MALAGEFAEDEHEVTAFDLKRYLLVHHAGLLVLQVGLGVRGHDLVVAYEVGLDGVSDAAGQGGGVASGRP